MPRHQTIKLCPHAVRRHRQRAGAWGIVDLYGTARDAWQLSKHRHVQSNGRWHIMYQGYQFIFDVESETNLHPDATQDVTLITYMTTYKSR